MDQYCYQIATKPGGRMAWVQERAGSYRVLFRHGGSQHTVWLGEVSEKEARATADKVDYWLMRLKQGLVTLPPGCEVAEFVKHDGRPPAALVVPATPAAVTLSGLRNAYLRSQGKKLEATTIAGIVLHFEHLVRLLGADRLLTAITRPDLQGYVDARSGEWIDPNVYHRRRTARAAAAPPKRKYTRKTPAPAPAGEKPKRHPSAQWHLMGRL